MGSDFIASKLCGSVAPISLLYRFEQEVDHAEMDLANLWRLSLQQPVPELTGIGRSAILRAVRFPRRVRGIRTRLLSGIRLLPCIPIPGIPLLLLWIWLLSAICISTLWI